MIIETCDFCKKTSKNDKFFIYRKFIYRKVDGKDCCEKCLIKIRKSCNHFYNYSTSSYGQGDGLHKVLKCERCGFILDPEDNEFYSG